MVNSEDRFDDVWHLAVDDRIFGQIIIGLFSTGVGLVMKGKLRHRFLQLTGISHPKGKEPLHPMLVAIYKSTLRALEIDDARL